MLTRKSIACFAIAIAAIGTMSAGAIASADSFSGGWSESEGYVSFNDNNGIATCATEGSPIHTGKAEYKTINGTTNKRSHGWTTWKGVKHHTTARLEHNGLFCKGKVIASAKDIGKNGTEAYTVWKPFKPNACCDGQGQAKTYYDRE